MQPKNIIITVLLSLLFLFKAVNGQIASTYDFKFKNYTTQNGLVHNFTKKCRKDSRGFLWIITQNGLSRFDGVNFKNFQNKLTDSSSLPYNDILDIAIDNDDKIWLAYGKGLCFYNQKTQKFVTIKSTLNTQAISLVFNTQTNTIWYNTMHGLLSIDTKKLQVTASNQNANYPNRPYTTCIDSKKQIWTGIDRLGYYCYNTNNNTYKYFAYNCWPRNFDEDDEGNMWISTWSFGLQLFDKKEGANPQRYDFAHTKQFSDSSIFQNAVQSIPLSGKNILWVLNHTDGIGLFDKQKRKFIKWIKYNSASKSSLLSSFGSSIYADKDGMIWVCSWRGLSKINKQEQQFQSTELPILESSFYNLLAGIQDDPYDSNICWMAVQGSGIVKYDKIKQAIVQRYFYSSNSIKQDAVYDWRWVSSINKDSKKRLWLSTYGGAIMIDKGNVIKIPTHLEVSKNVPYDARILEDGNFWIFTKNGLIKLNTDTKQYSFYRNIAKNSSAEENLANRISDVLMINSNTLFCATQDGLYTLNLTSQQFTKVNINLADTIGNRWKKFYTIQKIDNKIYAGSESGLLEYDLQTKEIIVKGKEQEIFKLELNSLRKDSIGKLWIYTLHGLFRYDPLKNEFKKFTSADGIYDNSTDPVQMFEYNNNMYIGYRMAYTMFNPLEVDANNSKVKPIITEFKINNQPSKILIDSFANKTLHLKYTENNLVFDFSGIDYTASERITFAHKLEGFDKDWVYDGTKRTATYANLSGEKYTFKVKACNSSGLWNTEPAIFNIEIHPPFWQTWWFKFLLICLFIALVVMLALARIKKIQQKEEEKTAANKVMAELEMKALRSQMNPHFIFNSLNSIQKYIWDNKQEDASEYLTKFAKLIRIILNNSMHKLVSLEEEMISLQLYLELEHRRCNNKFDYTVHIDSNIITSQILVPPMLMQPYIENAIWHGLLQKEDRGKLSIYIHQPQQQMLTCIIEDDGIGRKKAEELKNRKETKTASYGMQITQQRLSIVENDGELGKVIVEDLYDTYGKANGTKITLKIPIETFQKIG